MPDEIAYRPMTVADVDATGYIRKAALEALGREQGKPPCPWSPARAPHFEHLLRTDADGAWVATIGGTAVGYSMGFTRGAIWFLAQLFVQPETHAKGIGRELLRLAMDAGGTLGATIFSVVSSTSPVAQSLYMQAGMFAIGIGYRVRGPVDALLALAPPAGNQKLALDCSGWQDRFADLDARVYGGARREDHALYLSGTGWTVERHGFALNRAGQLCGYGYAWSDGHIGPFSAYEPEDVPPLMHMAGEWLRERGVEEANGFLLTTNPTALGPLLRRGWKISSWTFLFATERFGQLDRYVPGGGLLL